jgi:hypothetical protein
MSIVEPGSETFQRRVLNIEKEKLTYYTEKSTKLKNEEVMHNLFIHLSIFEILKNTSKTLIKIIDDLLNYKIYNMKDVLTIFTKDDRLIYLGIIMLFISFSLYIIDLFQ